MPNSPTTSKYGTAFIESEIVLAAQAGDWSEVDRLVGEMSSVEARTFRRALMEVNAYLEFQGRNDNSNNRGG